MGNVGELSLKVERSDWAHVSSALEDRDPTRLPKTSQCFTENWGNRERKASGQVFSKLNAILHNSQTNFGQGTITLVGAVHKIR